MESGPRYGSEQEIRYFRIFCDSFAPAIAGPFAPTLWKQLIPQASELEPFLRDGMVAIGALSRVYNMTGASATMVHGEGAQIGGVHHFALRKYDQALQGLRKATEQGTLDLRNALFSCLLIFCVETLQGRQGPAARLCNSGLVLYNKWRAEKYNTISSQKRFLLEDELSQAFVGIDLQALLFLDNRSLQEQDNLGKLFLEYAVFWDSTRVGL